MYMWKNSLLMYTSTLANQPIGDETNLSLFCNTNHSDFVSGWVPKQPFERTTILPTHNVLGPWRNSRQKLTVFRFNPQLNIKEHPKK